MFSEGDIECVEELLKPAKRVLKEGMSVKHEAFERRVELWNKIQINKDSYLDEKCGTFLKDLDQHFCSLFDGSLLVLAASFRENGELFGAANIFSDAEVKLFQNIEHYNLLEILSAYDIRRKLIQKDTKVLNLLREYYLSMDSWVDGQLEDPQLRLTLRYYLKKRWDSYKGKLNQAVSSSVNQAVSSSVIELDWLKSLISSWEQETKTRDERIEDQIITSARTLAAGKIKEIADRNKEVEEQLKALEAEKARAEEQIKTKESEKILAEQQTRKLEIEKEAAEKQAQDLEAKNKDIEKTINELLVIKAIDEGKGSRYVKLEEVKQYELNFIGRMGHRLGDTVTFSGKTYKVENLKEIKHEDTSRLGEIYRLSERDLKNLPENRSLVGYLTEKKFLGKKQRYMLKALFFARVEKYAGNGYDTAPLELKDINACLVDSRDEAKGNGEWILLCLASPTGFETTVDRHISSEDFHRNFLSRYLSVCLLDLETGKQLYNPNDEVAKEFAKLCELETDREKSEKLKISVRKTIDDGLLLKDFVVLADIAKILGNDAAIKPAFYEYADEKGLNVKFVEDVGLLMMK